jgi:lysozyme
MNSEDLIRKHEGTKMFEGRHIPYKCSQGVLTIGIGRNLEKGISEAAAKFLFDEDMAEIRSQCKTLSYYHKLDNVRQAVIENMVFNLGFKTFKTFTRTGRAIEEGKYEDAAQYMLESLWARQVGNRAKELAAMMKTGEWQ